MENKRCVKWLNIALVLFAFIFFFSIPTTFAQIGKFKSPKPNLQTYIVHVNQPQGTQLASSDGPESYYRSFLPAGTTASDEEERLVFSYKNVLTGFAARLTAEEAKLMEKMDGVLLAYPERILQTQTTHTPNFLGLYQESGFWPGSNFGKGVIVGVLDTGILPTHPSFSDDGVPPPPAKWKGKCDFGSRGGCNNKLIGARNFLNSSELPNDEEGHGTHTASTATGNTVKDANVLGEANGTAIGIAPLAHLAIYKVCDESGCPDSAILAAMDTAVDDGVDVLSLSLGGGSDAFYADGIAVGAFGAIRKGIFVSCSAGNEGPGNSTLSNEAPWILTVGASTIDRMIKATAQLGNGNDYDGESLYQPSGFSSTLLPLVYAGANGNSSSAFCAPGSLNKADVRGKVVLCLRGGQIARVAKGQTVLDAGGAAMTLMNDEADAYSTLADAHVLPATHISYAAGLEILDYINSTSNPTATILFKGTIIGSPLAPEVTSFSSRGPSLASPGILKPDIIGPGVSILAAWPFPLENNTDTTQTFDIISGTSMSCPHLSGIAALLKSAHPDWSPAAIKSAIMTTADLLNLGKKPIIDETLAPANIFATGAGHVNPSRANDPGLIYDIQTDDYVPYLCGLGYTDAQIAVIAHRTVNCGKEGSIPEAQLNYPTFSVSVGQSVETFTRTVTNVGEATSSYSVEIFAPEGVNVTVSPTTLDFTEVNQKKTYAVTFSRASSGTTPTAPFSQGYLQWVSGKRFVRSQIVATFVSN